MMSHGKLQRPDQRLSPRHRVVGSRPAAALRVARPRPHCREVGCGLGQCGACNVLVDGHPTPSCLETIANAEGKSIVTLEGLGTISAPHPVQAAFIKEQVPQCGYCTSGVIISAAALLAEKPKPTANDIRAALDGNLCRCGTHVRIMRAVMAASGQGG